MARSHTPLLLAALHLALVAATSGLKVPTFIDSNLVLQRAPTAAVVWGWANVSTETSVTATLNGVPCGSTKVAADGSWTITLTPQPAGTGHTLVLATNAASSAPITLTNIAFGEVYLCSGQSNMQFSVNDAFNASAEIADSIRYPDLRLFTVKLVTADAPQPDAPTATNYTWGVSGPSTLVPVGGPAFSWFSATCYFFGRDMYRSFEGRVPVGLVASDWGGQRVEAFSSPAAMADRTCGGTAPTATAAGRGLSPRPTAVSSNEGVEGDDAALYTAGVRRPHPATSQLWFAMIYPLAKMRFAAATWYQGEANAGDPPSYACRFPAMIADWRKQMDLPLPFYFVQLAGYSADYSLIREAQMAALKLPRVGYAIAVDIGDPTSPEGNIHPRRKQEVGRRLSLSVLALQYNGTAEYLGPEVNLSDVAVAVLTPNTSSVTLTFSHAAGLHAAGTAACTTCCSTSPFEVSDGVTRIAANFTVVAPSTVVLTAPIAASDVVQVFYDFTGYPQCALYNGIGGPDNHTGLPAPPFRTAQPPAANYTLVARQTWPSRWSVGATSVNPHDPTADQYAVLDTLEQFRRAEDGKLGFKLVWPLANGKQHWKQTSNPTSTPKGKVVGFQAINCTYSGEGWGGLGQSSFALLDGSQSGPGIATTWFYAIGAFEDYIGGLPSGGTAPVSATELYARSKSGGWTLLFRQTAGFWFSPSMLSLNKLNPEAPNYSILDELEGYRGADGAFEFKLVWPDQSNTWLQQSNPSTTPGLPVGYAPGRIMHGDSWWGGLEKNPGGESLLDGSVLPGATNTTWFYAVGDYGTVEWGQDGIPGWSTAQQQVELYVMRSAT